jgi:hypothetical protein
MSGDLFGSSLSPVEDDGELESILTDLNTVSVLQTMKCCEGGGLDLVIAKQAGGHM